MNKKDPKARRAEFLKPRFSEPKALSTGGTVDKISQEWETFFKPEGISFKLNDPLHKNDFDLSFCLPYGFWKDCTIVFNIKITKVSFSSFSVLKFLFIHFFTKKNHLQS